MVVDLEATSTGEQKIIQVGIVVIENGEIIDQYPTDVNPHEPCSHIKRINWSDRSAFGCGTEFSQVAGKFFELVRTVFLLH